ncbi:MAG: aminotransferase class IV [Bacteroidota bacterium]
MNKTKYYIQNGVLQEFDNASISVLNRSFRYGDGLFETIRLIDGFPIFLDDHILRLHKSMKLLKYHSVELLNFEVVKRLINNLIASNNSSGNARIRLQVFRNEGGLFLPTDNSYTYIIELEDIDFEPCVLNEKGLSIDIYTESFLAKSIIQSKTSSSLIYILASLYRKEMGVDDILILNSDYKIVEANSSNVFCVKDKVIYTPHLSSGCIDGVFRKNLIESINQSGEYQIEEAELSIDFAKSADELFITNVVRGIQWVEQFQNKSFVNVEIQRINEIFRNFIML